MTEPFTKQYGPVLTDVSFLPGMAYTAGRASVDTKVAAPMNLMLTSFRAANAVPDQVAISAWIRRCSWSTRCAASALDASSTKIRDAMIGAKGMGRVNGAYDYSVFAQRGIGQAAIVMVRWDTNAATSYPSAVSAASRCARRSDGRQRNRPAPRSSNR